MHVRICHRCRREITLEGKIGRREACPGCGADLHCCLNCSLHDPGAYNQCREPQAERVPDKDRGNFCDWFRFRDAAGGQGTGEGKGSAEDRLKALFKSS